MKKTPVPQFNEQAGLVVQQLQEAVAEVVAAVPGVRIDRAARLAEALDLGNGLAWKIFKAVNGEDPMSAAQYVPGAEGIRIFLNAARKRNVPDEVIARARGSYDAFEELVRVQAGSRKSFDMMTAGISRTDRRQRDLAHRKGAFEHQSYIFGVQAKTLLRTWILQAAADGRTYDCVAIHGFVDLRLLRQVVPWCMSRCYTIDDAGTMQTTYEREPLDPDGAAAEGSAGLPLMQAFCSRPDLTFQRVRRPNNVDDYLLVNERIGTDGLVTCFSGELLRSAETRYRDATHQDLLFMPPVRIPCEALLLDIFVHRDLFGPLQLTQAMYCDAGMRDPTQPLYDWERLPLHDEPEYLGPGMTHANAPDVPRYLDLLRYGFDRAGWDSQQFDAYRLRVFYPPVPATVTLSHPMPPPPEDVA